MTFKRVAILISGGGSNMVALLRAMTGDFPARPILVVSNVADAGGLSKAADLGVPTAVVDYQMFPTRHRFEQALHETLRTADADILCLAGFMRILSYQFVQKWSGQCLNIHPSLLPKFKGLNTHARALQAGETEHGCSVHEVTADLDDGPILGQAKVGVMPRDTPATLAARVLEQEHQLYPAALRRFSDGNRDRFTLSSSD